MSTVERLSPRRIKQSRIEEMRGELLLWLCLHVEAVRHHQTTGVDVRIDRVRGSKHERLVTKLFDERGRTVTLGDPQDLLERKRRNRKLSIWVRVKLMVLPLGHED